MAAMLGLSVPAAVAARVAGARALRPTLAFAPPAAALDWAVLASYAVAITAGQLAMAKGYQTVAAGRAAVLATTEMAFAYVLDVAALREPTSALAAAGTAAVFAGVALVAAEKGRAAPAANAAAAGGPAERDAGFARLSEDPEEDT